MKKSILLDRLWRFVTTIRRITALLPSSLSLDHHGRRIETYSWPPYSERTYRVLLLHTHRTLVPLKRRGSNVMKVNSQHSTKMIHPTGLLQSRNGSKVKSVDEERKRWLGAIAFPRRQWFGSTWLWVCTQGLPSCFVLSGHCGVYVKSYWRWMRGGLECDSKKKGVDQQDDIERSRKHLDK